MEKLGEFLMKKFNLRPITREELKDWGSGFQEVERATKRKNVVVGNIFFSKPPIPEKELDEAVIGFYESQGYTVKKKTVFILTKQEKERLVKVFVDINQFGEVIIIEEKIE